MPIASRWTEHIPNCSLQQWIFGSPTGPVPDRKVFVDADRPETHYVTMAQYRLVAKRIALGLKAHGLKTGDRVLVFSGTNLVFPCVFLGILMAGGVFTGANPGYVPRELAHQLRDSGAVFMVSSEASLDTALDAADQVGLPRSNVFSLDKDAVIPGLHKSENPSNALRNGARRWTELLGPQSEAESFEWTEPSDARNTTCCLNYSSGTTGVPKGAEITHYSYVAHAVGIIKVFRLREEYERNAHTYSALCFLPLYHAYGQTWFLSIFPQQGFTSYLMPSFDFIKFLTHIQTFRITHLAAVPPIYNAIVKNPIAKKFDYSSLLVIGNGAAPIAPDILNEADKLLAGPDVKVRTGWGMTELTCSASTWDPTKDERGSISVGEIMPDCALRIVDADGSEITSPGKPGEVWVAGPIVMKGYWKNTKATDETIVVDENGTRWLRTGDIGYVDKYETGALLYLVDRMKELIKVKGNQVAPAELEALLLERPDLTDVGVVGVTIKGEELPRAYVVRAPGSNVSAEEISKWVEGKVIKHKWLKGGIAFVDAIPKNPSGKILRKVLREKAKLEVGDRTPPTSKLS